MILMLLKITPMPDRRWEVLSILRTVNGPASSLEGFLSCESFDGLGDEDPVLHLESWESMEPLRHYLQSPIFARVLEAMEMSKTAPAIQFMDVSRTWGLELLESLGTEKAKRRGARLDRP